MKHPFEAKNESALVPPASYWRWLTTLSLCLPLFLVRIWFLSLPLQYYDFITYWTAGHLFVTGGHPYSQAAISALPQLPGVPAQPQLMLAPPWTLPIVALMSLWPFRTGQAGWWAISILLNCFSSIGLWMYFGGAKHRFWVAILIAATFIPMGGAEFMGQITPLMLASLTAFLLCLKSKRHFAAGALLLGVGFKPHLLYLFSLAVLLWVLQTRTWSVLAGAGTALVTATLATFLFNANALDYFHETYGLATTAPCGIGWVLRESLGVQHAWLQFLPCIFGLMWFAFYWARHRRDWDWPTHLPLLLIVSVASSPYCWYHDFILILPALIALAARGACRVAWVAAAYLGVQAAIAGADILSPAWMCVASVLWIPFYLAARTVSASIPEESSVTRGQSNNQPLAVR